MSSPTNTWSDRRGQFQRGKEIHEPGRKLSGSFGDEVRRASINSITGGGLEKTTSNTSDSPTGQGRRPSGANPSLFGKLNDMKRGSEGYGDRRASWDEMKPQKASFAAGWFDKTFRGSTGPGAAAGGAGAAAGGEQKGPKRGVME